MGRAKSGTLVEKVSPSSKGRAWRLGLFLAALSILPLNAAVQISDSAGERIGRRIWQNECGGTVSGLTAWNEGEQFASLGIGHFIWYPKDRRGLFAESFPPLLRFISQKGTKLPEFLAMPDSPCPWQSRAEFQEAQNSAMMKQLRQFLLRTVDLQAQFLVSRLQDSLPKMLAQAKNGENVRKRFDRLAASAQGCYALIDYVNFKGEGTEATERYRGQGWGLLQVLENMRDTESALDEFATSAKSVLRRRVANSPPAQREARWLPGWLTRVETYRNTR